VVAGTPLSTLTLSSDNFALLLEKYPRLRESIQTVAYSYSRTPPDMEGRPVGHDPDVPVETLPTGDASDNGHAAALAADAQEPERPVLRAKKFPILLQIGEMDCGAACLTMIGRYYGREYRMQTLRELSEVSRDGASLAGLAHAAEKLGFRARPVRAEFRHLERATLPMIVHWGGNHFIVLYQINKRGVTVGDPGIGLRRMSEEEFRKGWTGLALVLEPGTELAASEKSPGLVKRFLPLITPHWRILLEVLGCSIILQVLGLATPLFTQAIVDRVIVHRDLSMLNLMLGGMVAVVVFQLLTSALRQYLLVFAVRRIDVSMAVQFLNHILRLPTRYFENMRVGDLVTRFGETENIRRLLTSTAITVLLDTTTIVIYIALMATYNLQLTALVLVGIPLFASISVLATPALLSNFRATFEAHSTAQSHLVETISGVQAVKAVCAERPVRWKWEELLLKYIRLQFKAMNFHLLLDSLGTIMQVSVNTALLWFGARLVIAGHLTVGQLMAFFALTGTLMASITRTIGVWDEIQNVRMSLQRLADVLDSKAEEPHGDESLPSMPRIDGHVRFEKVTFRYTEQARTNAIENIDLEILPGQTVALVGRSGCGKSTLIKMLMRLYDPTSGRITVDGQDISKVNLASWRTQVGAVLQESFLFSGTIRENIALGHPHATFDQVRRAAILAGAHDFISELPLGYNTLVGERGSSLSGGQRQRINIARALLADPRILVLDEATSALDTESERAIQRNLETVLRDRTTLVIAHRLSTVRNANKIVVLDRGVIVEQGTHEELMGRKGLYFYLCSQQLDQ
jgi:ATP-binding cassette subfamily B protein